MPEDLFDYPAYLPDSLPPPIPGSWREGSTLTVQLRVSPGAMGGRLSVQAPAAQGAEGTAGVHVALPDQAPFTFTPS